MKSSVKSIISSLQKVHAVSTVHVNEYCIRNAVNESHKMNLSIDTSQMCWIISPNVAPLLDFTTKVNRLHGVGSPRHLLIIYCDYNVCLTAVWPSPQTNRLLCRSVYYERVLCHDQKHWRKYEHPTQNGTVLTKITWNVVHLLLL